MEKVLKLYKKVGETPLGAIETFRRNHPTYRDTKMTYAGRLDPMAEGLLIVLTGDEVYKKEEYLGLSKEYELDILLGFSSDSYDVLGLVEKSSDYSDVFLKAILEKKDEILGDFIGKFEQKYPPFSSKTVAGTPLWQHTRKNSEEGNFEAKEPTITEIPSKEVEIFGIDFLGVHAIQKGSLYDIISQKISTVSGDFRQKEILSKWENVIKTAKNGTFSVLSLRVQCSSGTYMRSLAHNFGEKIGIPALAYGIKRLKIGDFSVLECLTK